MYDCSGAPYLASSCKGCLHTLRNYMANSKQAYPPAFHRFLVKFYCFIFSSSYLDSDTCSLTLSHLFYPKQEPFRTVALGCLHEEKYNCSSLRRQRSSEVPNNLYDSKFEKVEKSQQNCFTFPAELLPTLYSSKSLLNDSVSSNLNGGNLV